MISPAIQNVYELLHQLLRSTFLNISTKKYRSQRRAKRTPTRPHQITLGDQTRGRTRKGHRGKGQLRERRRGKQKDEINKISLLKISRKMVGEKSTGGDVWLPWRSSGEGRRKRSWQSGRGKTKLEWERLGWMHCRMSSFSKTKCWSGSLRPPMSLRHSLSALSSPFPPPPSSSPFFLFLFTSSFPMLVHSVSP